MKNHHTLRPFLSADPTEVDAAVELWNDTLPVDLHISANFMRYNSSKESGISLAGQWALINNEIVGLVIAGHFPDHPQVSPTTSGWIDLIVVHPAFQQQGIGTSLLAWAEEWLLAQDCHTIGLGGSVRPFMPGVPVTPDTLDFFRHHHYGNQHIVWDLSANLAAYAPPEIVRPIEAIIRPAQPADIEQLDLFLQREFPGRWHWGLRDALATDEPRLADYMVLWSARGVDGFCRLTFEDSHLPIERYYPYRLPRPWGQLGPIGVSADKRGQGFGAALLDAGLRRLHNNGVNGCVIDWTTIVDFYAHFGFQPYREYLQMSKSLEVI